MVTQKWHLFDHLVDAIREIGGIEYLHRGLYESADKIFETLYRKSSKRRQSAMDKTVERYNRNVLRAQFQGNCCERLTRQNPCKLYVMKHDKEAMLASGLGETLAKLESFATIFASPTRASIDAALWTTPLHSMIIVFEEDRLRAICTLLREYFREKSENLIEKRHWSIIMPASAYFPGITTST